jgi:hypothetical protein
MEKNMRLSVTARILLALLGQALAFTMVVRAQAAQTATPYPKMAPVDQYLMNRDEEIALAKSAAPKAISDNADVMVMERQGYVTAVHGTNGFVCVVERGWTAPSADPNFWNPKLRGPLCLNGPAARTYLPITIEKTKLVLAGKSKEQMFETVGAELDRKQLPPLEPGAMCYMMSKDGNLGDGNGHWRPHLMFFVPAAEANTWGAGAAGSPIIESPDPADRMTVFLLPIAKWSDGTTDAGH